MATYFLNGKYSTEALKGISAERTQKAEEIIGELGGTVLSKYILLGERDLVLIVEFPSVDEVLKASVALTQLSGITFTTSPAVPVEEFDALMQGT
jgi:uncharacterized protein with GYD domain